MPVPASAGYRVTFTRIRGAGSIHRHPEVQLSELNLFDADGISILSPNVVATNPAGGVVHPQQTAAKAVDGRVDTKWVDGKFEANGYASVLELKLPTARAAASYQFWSANDVVHRDPVSWTMEVRLSDGGWAKIDEREMVEVPMERHAPYSSDRFVLPEPNFVQAGWPADKQPSPADKMPPKTKATAASQLPLSQHAVSTPPFAADNQPRVDSLVRSSLGLSQSPPPSPQRATPSPPPPPVTRSAWSYDRGPYDVVGTVGKDNGRGQWPPPPPKRLHAGGQASRPAYVVASTTQHAPSLAARLSPPVPVPPSPSLPDPRGGGGGGGGVASFGVALVVLAAVVVGLANAYHYWGATIRRSLRSLLGDALVDDWEGRLSNCFGLAEDGALAASAERVALASAALYEVVYEALVRAGTVARDEVSGWVVRYRGAAFTQVASGAELADAADTGGGAYAGRDAEEHEEEESEEAVATRLPPTGVAGEPEKAAAEEKEEELTVV